jgi:hypothetical protein
MLTPVPLSAMITALPQALGPELLPGWTWVGQGAGPWAAPVLGLAMMAALAGFPLLAAARALAPQSEPPESWAEALDRKVSAICVLAFAVLGGLCGGLALAAWVAQGPVAVLGLGTAAAAFLSAAQITAGQALRA